MCTTMLYGQTSEVYSYISNYVVNTGTGERKQWRTTVHFYCRFNSDKSICYETNDKGELDKDRIYRGRELDSQGLYYNWKGAGVYKYLRTENGVRIYEQHWQCYKKGYYDDKTKQWHFSELDEGRKYVYFSTDYSKLNQPLADNQVFTYDRIFPDKPGAPTQIW